MAVTKTGLDRRPLLAGIASALVVLVLFGWFVTFGPGRSTGAELSAMEAAASQSPKRSSQTPTPVATGVAPRIATPSPGSASTSTQPVPRTEDEALAMLTAKTTASQQAVKIQGQWVAQLASKYVGIVDPAQVTASGGHKFFAVDILNEHLTLASDL